MQWADAARGIAILLVLFGHTCPPPYTTAFIYAFHMPLFFFLSGMFMQIDTPLRPWLRKRVRTLLVPFVIFNLVLLVSDWCIVALSPNAHTPVDIPGRLMGTLTGWRSAAWLLFEGTWIHSWNSSLWFLPALFVAQGLLLICYRLLNSLSDPRVSQFPIFNFPLGAKRRSTLGELSTCLLSLAGAAYAYYVGLALPMSLDAALVATVFLLMGREWLHRGFSGFQTWYWVVVGIVFVVTTLQNFHSLGGGNNHVDMSTCTLGQTFNFYIAATAGSLLMVRACQKWEGHALQPLFQTACWLGRNSLCIYCLHRIPMNLGIGIWNAIVMSPAQTSDMFTLSRSLILLTFTVLLLVPAVYVVNRWFPWTLGRQTSIH